MLQFAYRHAARRHRILGLLGAAALATWGCQAGVKAPPTGTGGSGGASGPGTGGSLGSGTGGGGGTLPAFGGAGGSNDPDAGMCQHAGYTFEPKIPTVYLL